jgi:hypothetical protein
MQVGNDVHLIGTTRGVYLEGYGAVFTANVSLATPPLARVSIIQSAPAPQPAQQPKDQVQAKKLERLPALRTALKQSLAGLASSLDSVPPDEQIVIVALLLRYPGEDKVPEQVMAQGSRGKLLEAEKAGPAVLDLAVRITEGESSLVKQDSLDLAGRSLDGRLKGLWNDLAVIGPSRGIYLEDRGPVFTAEVTVVTAPISIMGSISQERWNQIRATKLERLPQLRAALKQALVELASSLESVPPDRQIAIGLLMLRYPGEEKLPVQIIVQGTKQKLLEAKQAGSAGLDLAVRTTEY